MSHGIEERIVIAQREEYARQKAIYDQRYKAWADGGKVGNPPPHPVPPHTPGPHNADLVFVDQMRDTQPDSFDEMRELVKTLPLKEQLRLSKLSPHKFRREARRLIAKHEAIRSAQPDSLLGPNAKRRLGRVRDHLVGLAEQMLGFVNAGAITEDDAIATMQRVAEYQRTAESQSVEEEGQEAHEYFRNLKPREPAVICELCGLWKDPVDHDGHGLGECVAICGACNGAGEIQTTQTHYVTRDMAIDAGEPAMEGEPMQEFTYDQCQQCSGTGGIRFPEQPPL